MKNNFAPKLCGLFLWMISLSSCIPTNQCDGFNQQSDMMTITLFSEEITNYEFASTNNPNTETLRLIQQRFVFSEAYEEECDDEYLPCDCYATHRTRYSFENLPLMLGNDMSYSFRDEDPIAATIRYLAFNQNEQILDDVTYGFPSDDTRINRDINNLVEQEITVNGETFRDVIVANLDAVNMTLYVERRNGLQGILYQGEIYRRID